MGVFFFRFSLLCWGVYCPYYTFRLREVGGIGSGGLGVVLVNLHHPRSCPNFFLILPFDASLTSSSNPSSIPLHSFSFRLAFSFAGEGGELGYKRVYMGWLPKPLEWTRMMTLSQDLSPVSFS